MCDGCNQTEAADPGYGIAGQGVESAQLKADVSTFRKRLEARRNRLSRQLVEVEEALRLIYSNPDAERIYETFNRTGM
jgi:hypothetical protein